MQLLQLDIMERLANRIDASRGGGAGSDFDALLDMEGALDAQGGLALDTGTVVDEGEEDFNGSADIILYVARLGARVRGPVPRGIIVTRSFSKATKKL